jgi:hypothetical protein
MCFPEDASHVAARRWLVSPRLGGILSGVRGEVDAAIESIDEVQLPATTLCQVGEVASSKSASHTLAPEFNAFTVIDLVVGPVISTRRSSKQAMGERTRQFPSSGCAWFLAENQDLHRGDAARPLAPLGE